MTCCLDAFFDGGANVFGGANSSSFASIDCGEGGDSTTDGVGGLGGYECAEPEVISVSTDNCDDDKGEFVWEELGGMEVRHANEIAASAKFGETLGTGRSGMNIPGGKDGARTRMYQPRFGRCIDQQMVEVAFSYSQSEQRRKNLYH